MQLISNDIILAGTRKHTNRHRQFMNADTAKKLLNAVTTKIVTKRNVQGMNINADTVIKLLVETITKICMKNAVVIQPVVEYGYALELNDQR